MTRPEHKELWNRIQQFVFDDQNATITFSRKLAEQQNWSPAFTAKAIEEYRKFIFLCCISPKGASPSKIVDEVWHLHLTYTQSYWNAFCKNTLQKDIHHYPSAGGKHEDHKHSTWYAETLSLYKSVFGTEAPADVWPPPMKQQAVIDEPAWHIRKQLVLIIALLVILPFAISYAITGIMSPYSLTGTWFLVFFALLVLAAAVAYFLLQKDRESFTEQVVAAYIPENLTVFQLAQFLYGKHRAVQTSIVDLYRRNLIDVSDDQKIVIHNSRYDSPSKEQNQIMSVFLSRPDKREVHYSAISDKWCNPNTFSHPVLQKLHTITEHKTSIRIKFIIIAITALIGLARVMQGIHNHRPVSLLVIEMVVFVVAVVLIERMMPLEKMLYGKVEELMRAKVANGDLYADQVVAEFAMHGQTVINWLPAALMLRPLFAVFPVAPVAATGSGTGDSSWGNGSSCSGGSSCGGGAGCGGCSGSSD